MRAIVTFAISASLPARNGDQLISVIMGGRAPLPSFADIASRTVPPASTVSWKRKRTRSFRSCGSTIISEFRPGRAHRRLRPSLDARKRARGRHQGESEMHLFASARLAGRVFGRLRLSAARPHLVGRNSRTAFVSRTTDPAIDPASGIVAATQIAAECPPNIFDQFTQGRQVVITHLLRRAQIP